MEVAYILLIVGGTIMDIRLKAIKKALLKGNIYISNHSKQRMLKRGYGNVDIIRGILNGKIVEVQKGYDSVTKETALRFVIEGRDYHGNPIAIVLAERLQGYCLVTTMPPIDRKRFEYVI